MSLRGNITGKGRHFCIFGNIGMFMHILLLFKHLFSNHLFVSNYDFLIVFFPASYDKSTAFLAREEEYRMCALTSLLPIIKINEEKGETAVDHWAAF